MPKLPPSILRRVIRALLYAFCRIEIAGLENVPPSGGLLGAANHVSRLDGPLIFATVPRTDATALAAEDYRAKPFFRWVLDSVGVIWLDRDNPDPQTIKTAIKFLRGGGMLGIAPEGTRSKVRSLIHAKPGVAYLATKAEVPLIPVVVTGTETVFEELLRLRRPRLRVEFGEPFNLPPLDRKDRDASLQKNADEIMCRIAALLPESYRGVYADHPRLKELMISGQ